MTGWIFLPSSGLSGRTPKFQCLPLDDGDTPEWYDTFSFVVDTAAKNNMQIGIHNCDGWSECGGPWVGVEDSMKAMTWVLKRSDGGEIEIEQPPSKYNFYRDIAVIAYPARRPAKPEAADKIAKITPANDTGGIAAFSVRSAAIPPVLSYAPRAR